MTESSEPSSAQRYCLIDWLVGSFVRLLMVWLVIGWLVACCCLRVDSLLLVALLPALFRVDRFVVVVAVVLAVTSTGIYTNALTDHM